MSLPEPVERMVEWLSDLGYMDAKQMTEEIKEGLAHGDSIHEVLRVMHKDVSWNEGHVGDDDTKPLYDAVRALISGTEKRMKAWEKERRDAEGED